LVRNITLSIFRGGNDTREASFLGSRFLEMTFSYFYRESSREARRLIDLLKELLRKPLKEPYKKGLNRVSKHEW
jgi:hypothetical protein